ncbi:MAG: anthrone oxygenase family protein [Bacteroidota bacterium]
MKVRKPKLLPDDKCLHSLRKHYFGSATCRDKLWNLGWVESKTLFTRNLYRTTKKSRFITSFTNGVPGNPSNSCDCGVAFLNRRNKAVFIALLIASALFGSCILISRFGNLPIQTEMLTWHTDKLPDNWILLRDKWWSFHFARTLVELLALVLVAWTSAQKTITDRLV